MCHELRHYLQIWPVTSKTCRHISWYQWSDVTFDKNDGRNKHQMKTIKSLWIMKYVCKIIIYKENKHMNVSYNVKKKLWKSVYSMKLETPKDHFFGFWHGDWEF